jgi:UDP-GlcNAc:undecaprenyl-phosphate GlcNAc-1-phosphate transferase
LGFLDDKFGTLPKAKFLVQIGIALALVLLGVRLKILPAIIAIPLTLVWIVMITNAFNLIDNMDGLSAGVAFIASMTIFLFSLNSGQATVPILALALAGACLGFLRYNFNPAKIFMGDCGSLLLGYILSTLAILGFWQNASPIFKTLTAPALILGYAVFDTTFVTILRLKAGGRPWVGGKDHSSHRLVKLGLSERQAVLLLYALGIIGSISAFIVLKTNLAIGVPLVVFLCMVAVAFGWILAKKTGNH